MSTYLGPAAVALALATGTGAAGAQTYITRDALGTETVIDRPLSLTPAQRTTTYRTIVPQGRGRKPIIKERIVTEPVVPAAPIVRERVVTRPAEAAYAYAPLPGERVVTRPAAESDYAYASTTPIVRERVVTPAPQPSYAYDAYSPSRPYRYVVNNRVLLIDPATNAVLADVTNEPWR